MYNSNYEEYMRNVLGYSFVPKDTYQMQENIYEVGRIPDFENETLENLYPDIYRMIYPMVQKACMQRNGVINGKAIDEMTEEIYRAMEETETRTIDSTTKINSDVRANSSQPVKKTETRQNNFLLRDLIRILILRELLQRPGRPPRPPMGRPPIGRPPIGRPPMMPGYPREMDY